MTEQTDSSQPFPQNFDHTSPALAAQLHETLAMLRSTCPIARSERRGGFWIITRYEDVVRVAKDWATFSSTHGVAPGTSEMTVKAIPEHVDPPLHLSYKRLINVWFTPQAMARNEQATRVLVSNLIDNFAHRGHCEFMTEFARPYPSRGFFELILGAPPQESAHVNQVVMTATDPKQPGSKQAWVQLIDWIRVFLNNRKAEPRRRDVIDAVLHAQIEGRPITEEEVLGIVQLLLLGGLDTTAGALGTAMIRLCEDPHLFKNLRANPQRIPEAVEELLRLDGPFIAIGRTAMKDVEIGGQLIKAGDKVLLYWTAANRDPAEFPNPDDFDLNRENKRHLSFGVGTHTCAGLSLARMNLRVALEELVRRLDDVRLEPQAGPPQYHSGLTRFPLSLPIRFKAST